VVITAACGDPLEPELEVDPLGFGTFDANADRQPTADEFHEGVCLADWFGDLDINDDLVLDDEELSEFQAGVAILN
jgi:hypothetical protein